MTTREAWNTAAVPARPPMDDSDRTRGLVLVYCERFAEMEPGYVLESTPLTLGREPDNRIPIQDNSASRYHARVEARGATCYVSDLGSTNGTIVDGRYIKESPLSHGALVRVGDTLFKFHGQAMRPYLGYRLDGAPTSHPRPTERTNEQSALIGGYLVDRVRQAIEQIARSLLSVVITGETGTGKEIASREIHRLSGRTGPLLAVNCAAIPEQLIESELFGARKGAFTGADRDTVGKIAAANFGTLFLDEIGDMPPEVQVKLLRAVQFGEVTPVGASSPEHVDVRVVSATHRDLREEVSAGGFRGDLFARLNEFHIHIPPLRARKEDLYMLVRHFLAKHGRPDADIPFALMLAAGHYDWPFNVRELESAVKRCAALAGPGPIEFAHLPDEVRDCLRDYGEQEVEAREEPESTVGRGRSAPPALAQLIELLRRHNGNISAIGREVGKERAQVHRWLKRYGLRADDFRP